MASRYKVRVLMWTEIDIVADCPNEARKAARLKPDVIEVSRKEPLAVEYLPLISAAEVIRRSGDGSHPT